MCLILHKFVKLRTIVLYSCTNVHKLANLVLNKHKLCLLGHNCVQINAKLHPIVLNVAHFAENYIHLHYYQGPQAPGVSYN